MSQLGEVVLTVDELEALRLADFESMYHEQAAKQMDVSRQTFGRIISSARHKVAEALVEGKALRIDGGEFRTSDLRTFRCEGCDFVWQVSHGTGRPEACPECHGSDFRRMDKPGRWVEEVETKD
jgi:predicted DNA-binding protein (UPF0251 family)